MLRTMREAADDAKGTIPTAEDLKEIWRRIRAALTRALTTYPEAQTAVLRELEAEFAPQAC